MAGGLAARLGGCNRVELLCLRSSVVSFALSEPSLTIDIEARKVGAGVTYTYKVDRLTRSLANFAKIVEVYDAMGAGCQRIGEGRIHSVSGSFSRTPGPLSSASMKITPASSNAC